ncbi:MAG: CDP-alcohol phosphatidyltransferase family protein [Acidimicrobiaceae bacterium]|nr:CDP-alcohol phosphatidyltransferase family protein [Acidimicrobiia bacterium]MCY4492265.1 CDP-alcohol phosphatidyltransferase family protein [Acidimicrobiaceae bacterium]
MHDAEPSGGPEPHVAIFDDRILTVPNLISLLRLAGIPVLVWLLFANDDRWAAAWLWGAIGATDWVDGWWARRFDAVSALGKLLDPVTDRAVLIVGVVAVGIDGAVPWWLVAATLAREGIVAVAGIVLGALGARRIEVTWWGKCATFGLYFSFPFLLAGASEVGVADWFWWAGWVCAVPSLLYSYLSAAQYIPLGLEALRDGRADRRA